MLKIMYVTICVYAAYDVFYDRFYGDLLNVFFYDVIRASSNSIY